MTAVRLLVLVGVWTAWPVAMPVPAAACAPREAQTVELRFSSHDGHAMFGKLTLPPTAGRHPVVVYVQTAEAMTVDLKRRLGRERAFNYFDIYRDQLPRMNAASPVTRSPAQLG